MSARTYTGTRVGVRAVDTAVETRPCYRCGRKIRVKSRQANPPFCLDCCRTDAGFVAAVRAKFAQHD